MKSPLLTYLIWLTLLLDSCNMLESKNNKDSSASNTDTLLSGIVTSSIDESRLEKTDSAFIVHFFSMYPDLQKYKDDVLHFYKNRSYRMAWHDQTGKIESIQILYNRIIQLEEHEIAEKVPYLEQYKHFIGKEQGDSTDFVDLMQTSQYFYFAHRVIGGLTEKELELLDWKIPKDKKDYHDLLERFIAGEVEAIDKSVYPQYHLLKNALVQLRQIQQQGGWTVIPKPEQSIRPGEIHPSVPLIKKRLFYTGALPITDTSALYTNELANAVSIFQKSHGLLADGITGMKSIDAMNIPVAERIKQVMINMERCRWLPYVNKGDYLVVNIPAFSLEVKNGDSLVFACEAIVGKETNRTVIFKGMMKYIVFNPYWNIPDNILKNEIIPKLAKNSNYLQNNNMEWYEGRLRQLPGPSNALGAIKFLFPNPFDIYLHDTPTKQLFGQHKRAFSHGCIRISAPHRLASYLLRNQKGWNSTKMDEVLATAQEHYVKLDEEVPVYIAYFTAFVDTEGKLNFRDDIYQKDESLMKMLIKF